MVPKGAFRQIKETEWRWDVQEAQMVSQVCATEYQGVYGVAMGTRMEVWEEGNLQERGKFSFR